MSELKIYNAVKRPTAGEKRELVDFLHKSLEQYGDPKKDIRKAIDYSVKEIPSFGGFTMAMKNEGRIMGVVVINGTGMGGYIPENILVYIATDKNSRGKGIGRKIMEEAIAYAKGDIALHVEAENPAKFLYEKLGFTNPYLEMRLKK
ncbi:MAG: GNAT family N-acetyltransferase [Cryomorphaceae bacterium]